MAAQAEDRGAVLVVPPGGGPAHWQPVPANGFVEVLLAPDLVAMERPFAMGTQTVPPGCFVREHAHDRNEEAILVLEGEGTALVDGAEHPMRPGATFFLGRNRRHRFENTGRGDLKFLWLMVPNGLEAFFAAIGRPKRAGEPEPTPFPRPPDVLEIERRTVFASPVAPPGG